MFETQAMKNKADSYDVFPRRILPLAILVALTIFAGGLVRQSAAQEPRIKSEPTPRIKSEPTPRIKPEPSPRIKWDLSFLDEFDFSSLDKFDFKLGKLPQLDNLDLKSGPLSSLDKLDLNLDLSSLDKLDLKLGKLPPLDKDLFSLDRLDLKLGQLSLLDKFEPLAQEGYGIGAGQSKEKVIDKGPDKRPDKGMGKGIGEGIGKGIRSSSAGSQSDDDPCEFKIEVLQALMRADPQRGIAVATDWLKPGSTQTVRCRQAALTLLARNAKASARDRDRCVA